MPLPTNSVCEDIYVFVLYIRRIRYSSTHSLPYRSCYHDLVNGLSNLDETYWEYSLALLKSLLDSRGQRSRSQQAVEMVKSFMSMLGCRSLSSSSSVDCDICKVIFVCTSRHQRHLALFWKSSHFTLKKFGYLMANQLNSGNWLLQWLWVSLCVLALRPIFSVWLVVSSFLVCTIGLKIFSTFSSL